MDGIHDLGGKRGFGRVVNDQHPVGFVERWHGAVFSMKNSAFMHRAALNTDHFRHAMERIDPISYLTDGYYGRWLGGLETLFVEAGHLDQQEITERARALGASTDARIAARPGPGIDASVQDSARRTASARRELASSPAFDLDIRVVTRRTPSEGHTRLPAYVRGAVGRVVAHQGAWVLPDSSAHGEEVAEHLYNVSFKATDLFGEQADPRSVIHIDLFESYIQRV